MLILIVAAIVRIVAALDYGRDWYEPGGFTLVNFDEGGSCRAALQGFDYTPFVGYQTLWLAALSGVEVPEGIRGEPRAVKAFCHGEGHLTTARLYSAVTGTLTCVALFVLSLLLFPGRGDIALGAAALLALSGWHISESMVGTVDAASTFFIYSFLAAAVWAARRGGLRWFAAMLLLLPALWTKYWVFALLALAALMPAGIYPQLFRGVSRPRLAVLMVAYGLLFGLVSNPALPAIGEWLLPLAFYALPPWGRLGYAGRLLFAVVPWFAPLAMQLDLFQAFSAGGLDGRFGSDYGAIGWHKLLRNLVNVPVVLIVGLGVPGVLALGLGIRRLWTRENLDGAWLAMLPLLAFVLYMAFLAPVTYYRHYLPLLPAACLLASLGLSGMQTARADWVWGVVLLWQGMLAVDLVSDYHFDPRRQQPEWYAALGPKVVMSSFFVNPPPRTGAVQRLFRVSYTRGQATRLRLADTLVLSENWYDTAFANELNGPLVHNPSRLIKTTPEAVMFYRSAVADRHPHLEQVARLRAPTFMPELWLHRVAYGSFTQFVGDLLIFRVRR